MKLVGGKDTFVQERLWPQLLAIVTAEEPWQLDNLTNSAAKLYRRVLRAGEIQASGPDASLLESRLLVRAEQFHTKSGHHEKRLESWKHWAERTGIARQPIAELTAAKEIFERIYPGAKWPWGPGRLKRRLRQDCPLPLSFSDMHSFRGAGLQSCGRRPRRPPVK